MAYTETFTTCAKNEWTKIATNVTSGQVRLAQRPNAQPLFASVATGATAPDVITLGVPFEGASMGINSTAAIDVYLWPVGDALRVRVDLG